MDNFNVGELLIVVDKNDDLIRLKKTKDFSLPETILLTVKRILKRTFDASNGNLSCSFSLKTGRMVQNVAFGEWYAKHPTELERDEYFKTLEFNEQILAVRQLLETEQYWPTIIEMFKKLKCI